MQTKKRQRGGERSGRYDEVQFLWAVLFVTRIRLETLAAWCGCSFEYFRREIYAGVPHEATRWAIERALDYRAAIWSDTKTLAARADCNRRLGIDPLVAGIEELRQFLTAMRVPSVSQLSRDRLAQKVFELAAANPRLVLAPKSNNQNTEVSNPDAVNVMITGLQGILNDLRPARTESSAPPVCIRGFEDTLSPQSRN